MAIDQNRGVLDAIRSVFGGDSVAGLSDARLIDRFLNGGGEASEVAFQAIVHRHGLMVLKVCRSVLGNEDDAQDASQAVFLVLAKRARSLRVRDTIGPWLHEVATRTSAAARRGRARRRWIESNASGRAVEPDRGVDDHDLSAIVHEELRRLPDRFRAPLVLCDLEGLSHQDAAARLGLPLGTLKSRQSRGRDTLRGRLIRRGLAPSAAIFLDRVAQAGVPAGFAERSARFAHAVLEGHSLDPGSIPDRILTMTQEVLRHMIIHRLKTIVLSLGLILVLGKGAFYLVQAQAKPAPPRLAIEEPAPHPEVFPPLGSLLRLRIVADATRDAAAVAQATAADGFTKPPEGYQWVPLAIPKLNRGGGLVIRRGDGEKPREFLLVKLDPQNLTERDVSWVRSTESEHGELAIGIGFTKAASVRMGALTRANLPENDGLFRRRVAILIDGEAIEAPTINSEIRNAAVLEINRSPKAPEFARIHKDLMACAWLNSASSHAKAASTQADALHQAITVDVPALARADRIAIDRTTGDRNLIIKIPKRVAALKAAIRPREVAEASGKPAAILSFSQGDEILRRIWIMDDGHWGFEREGRSFTLGHDPELWRLVNQ